VLKITSAFSGAKIGAWINKLKESRKEDMIRWRDESCNILADLSPANTEIVMENLNVRIKLIISFKF
jgi:hypothetical protein